MSIIYEALRKVQGKSDPGAIPAQGRLNPANPQPHSRKLTAIRTVIFILVLSALGLILAETLINRWFSARAQKEKAAQLPIPLISPSPEHSNPKEPAAPAETFAGAEESIGRTENRQKVIAEGDFLGEQLPVLALNGIVLSEDGNIALINDQILKAGDNIEGALVEEIAGNRVTLSFKAQKIILKAK